MSIDDPNSIAICSTKGVVHLMADLRTTDCGLDIDPADAAAPDDDDDVCEACKARIMTWAVPNSPRMS